MVVISPSEMLAGFQWTTRRLTLDNRTLYAQRCVNVKIPHAHFHKNCNLIVARRPVARQRPRNTQIYNSLAK
jgi:hypothetical protein